MISGFDLWLFAFCVVAVYAHLKLPALNRSLSAGDFLKCVCVYLHACTQLVCVCVLCV